MRKYLIIAFFFVTHTAWSAEGAPEVVAKYAEATSAENWSLALSMVHPDDVKAIANPYRELLTSTEHAAEWRNKLSLTDDEIAKLSDSELVGAVLSAGFREMRSLSSFDSMRISVLGSVRETPELVHFVAKSSGQVSGRQVSAVSVISARSDSGKWYVVLPDSMRSQAAALAQRYRRPGRPYAPPPAPR